MTEAIIESGFAKVEGGEWLAGRSQPAVCRGVTKTSCLRGLFVADRPFVRRVETADAAWFSRAESPFLTRIDALPDAVVGVVSEKVLVAPLASRVGAESLKLIPMSLQRAIAVSQFKMGWVIAATRSRVMRLSLDDGDTLTVRPDALVAWTGNRPTGYCPRLSVIDIILPRSPKDLAYTFHGPAVVWFEGAASERASHRRCGAARRIA